MARVRRITATEHEIQCAYIQLVERHTSRYPDLRFLRAFPNGAMRPFKVDAKGKRYSIVGQRLHAEGVRKGPLDIILPCRREIYSGLWFEFKRPGEKLKPEQDEYSMYLVNQGWFVDLQYDAEAAWAMTKSYLELEVWTN